MQKKTSTKQIRLNKYLASCGIASRRDADELIKAGYVEVNGKRVSALGVSVSEDDVVKVKGKIVEPEKKEYVIYHKPAGYITSMEDEKGRKTIYDALPENMRRLKPAGRLDKDSTGLLILTNDGELIQKLTHPTKRVPRVYRVTVEGKVTEQDLTNLKDGIEIEKGKIAYAEGVLLDCSNSESLLELTLYQGYYRQIRRMMEKIKHPVISLKRISHACITVSGLERGRFRYLKNREVQDLYNYLKKQ
jgi:pseudouridine synthase